MLYDLDFAVNKISTNQYIYNRCIKEVRQEALSDVSGQIFFCMSPKRTTSPKRGVDPTIRPKTLRCGRLKDRPTIRWISPAGISSRRDILCGLSEKDAP